MEISTLFVTVLGFAIFITLMSVGYIFAGKKIKGSCGGLNAAMTNDNGEKVCGFCGIEVSDPQVQDCQEK